MLPFKFILKNGDKMVSIELRNDKLYLEDEKGCNITSKSNVALSLSDKWNWTAYFLSGPVEQSIIDYLNDGTVNTNQYSFTAKLPWVEKEIKEQEKALYLEQVDLKFKSSFNELKRKSKQQIPLVSTKKYKIQTPQFNLNKPLNTPVKSLSAFKTDIMKSMTESPMPLRTPVRTNKPQTPISLSRFNHTTPTPMPKISAVHDASTVASDESDFAFDTSALIIPISSKQPFQELPIECPPSPKLEMPLSSRISFATSIAPSYEKIEDLKNISFEIGENSLDVPIEETNEISDIVVDMPEAEPVTPASLDFLLTNESLKDVVAGQDSNITSSIDNETIPASDATKIVPVDELCILPFSATPQTSNVLETPGLLKDVVTTLINDIGGPTASSLPCSLPSQEIHLKLSAVFDSSAYTSDEECSPKLNCPCLKEMKSAQTEICFACKCMVHTNCCISRAAGPMCYMCAIKSLKKLKPNIPDKDCAQYLSLAFHFSHLLLLRRLTKSGAIGFFEGLLISGTVGLQILLDAELCNQQGEFIVANDKTQRFVNKKGNQTMKILKGPVEAAFEEAEMLAVVKCSLTPPAAPLVEIQRTTFHVQSDINLKDMVGEAELLLGARYPRAEINL